MDGSSKHVVDTAVIAAAGYDTRLMPLTKDRPKAMVLIGEHPILYYVVRQLAAGGIRRFVIIVNPKFQMIVEYVREQQKNGEWKEFEFIFVEKESKSFADSVVAAEEYVKGNYFIAVACDDILDDQPAPFLSFMQLFDRYQKPFLILREITREQVPHYGGVSVEEIEADVFTIHSIVEKPSPDEAKSHLGSIADYILPPDIFDFIRQAQKDMPANKEVAVTHALKLYVEHGGLLLGWVFRGRHFDGGAKSGLAKAAEYFKNRS